MIKLSISNIAWSEEYDLEMYEYLQSRGVNGLEIAPSRIFPQLPYDRLSEAKEWSLTLKNKYNLEISSMQSIWYGRSEKMFDSYADRQLLIEYTKKAINFAEVIGCPNLVFGNPRNRDAENIETITPIAIDFFKEIGDYAYEHNTIVSLEPNPIIYNTRFLNYTKQAVDIVDKISSPGIKVNVDLGTIIYNDEDINFLKQIPEYINHIHVSEPNLGLIEVRDIHKQLFTILREVKYDKFISIEMRNNGNLDSIKEIIQHIKTQ